MKDRLKNAGLRLTPQRLELLKTLERLGPQHPSFSQICDEVNRNLAHVSRSTILKNLNELVQLGFISSFQHDGETRYEMNPLPHVNLVDSTGKIMDINDKEIQKLLTKLLKLVNKRVPVKAGNLLVLALEENS